MFVPIATCLDLTLPTNGAITYIPNTSPKLQNAAATYSCNNGYTLNGEAIRTCQANRTWSEVPAICLGGIMIMDDFVTMYVVWWGNLKKLTQHY